MPVELGVFDYDILSDAQIFKGPLQIAFSGHLSYQLMLGYLLPPHPINITRC